MTEFRYFCLSTGVNMCYNDKKYPGGDHMSVDTLQEKIRKLKNPTMLELYPDMEDLPSAFDQSAAGYADYACELLTALKDTVPAIRVSFGGFALLGAAGMDALSVILSVAKKLGYYVALDAPELLSVRSAALTAEALLGGESRFSCDGLIISGYAVASVAAVAVSR
jgi:hypothetical protein